jgi:magnesium transporter
VVQYCALAEGKIQETPDQGSPIVLYCNPSDAEKRYLVDHLGIDEHTLHSALDPDELSRLEFEPEHVASIFKLPRPYSAADVMSLKVGSAGAFLFRDRLIIVTSETFPLFDGIRLQPGASLQFLFLRLLYRSIYHFLEHLRVINRIADELQGKIETAMGNRYLINLFSVQKSLVYYLNSINANGVLIERLRLNAARIGFSQEALELLDDITVENNQCYRQAEIYSNILASLMDARASIVGNNLNVLMKTLTLITIAIMVPTFVVSAFSMNVPLPFGLDHDNQIAFWLIMGLATAAEIGLIVFWRWKKW